ncbi:MAG TPA: ROK family protein [Thermomicrobiales bacterium]|nr:ROK family protein [Thermomicrobiales bacterium]
MKTTGGAIGIDLGGTNLKLALLDGENCIVARRTVPTQGAAGHDAVLERMIDGVRELVAAQPEIDVTGVGIGVPGDVNMVTGITGDLPNLPGRWRDVPVGPTVAEATGLPVGVINDAKAFALAEYQLGAAGGANTALCVTVGTGIGGAVIAYGRILLGVGGMAGEIGHLILQPEGPRCTCGNLGCAETLANGPAIVAEAVRRVVQGFTTSLVSLSGGDLNAITAELVARAADEGDAVAADVIDRAGGWLGLTLAGAIALLAPEVVVIGGGVAPAGSRFFRAAEKTARAHTGVIDITRVAFRAASLGYEAGVIGAALLGRGDGCGVAG